MASDQSEAERIVYMVRRMTSVPRMIEQVDKAIREAEARGAEREIRQSYKDVNGYKPSFVEAEVTRVLAALGLEKAK